MNDGCARGARTAQAAAAAKPPANTPLPSLRLSRQSGARALHAFAARAPTRACVAHTHTHTASFRKPPTRTAHKCAWRLSGHFKPAWRGPQVLVELRKLLTLLLNPGPAPCPFAQPLPSHKGPGAAQGACAITHWRHMGGVPHTRPLSYGSCVRVCVCLALSLFFEGECARCALAARRGAPGAVVSFSSCSRSSLASSSRRCSHRLVSGLSAATQPHT